MGAELAARSPAARAVFERASDVLGYDVLELCTRGPAERLNSTTYSQPAIYTCSLAGLAAMEEEPSGRAALAEVDAVAGLSLGEYTALTYAEAWSFETGLRLVAARGEAMQAASERAPTGMLSVVGLDRAGVEKLAEEANELISDPGQHVALANLLCPGNYALSGGLEGCAAAARLARPRGARMAVPLAVAGAFHSRHMAPAAEALREALARADVRAPRRVVISNVDALPHRGPDELRERLLRQLTQPVRWEESVRALVDKGLARVLEVGPGKVIAGTVRRISKGLEVHNVVV